MIFFWKLSISTAIWKLIKWKRARMYGIPGRKSGKQLPANPPTYEYWSNSIFISQSAPGFLGNFTQWFVSYTFEN